jgi:hypothetical protein
MHCSQYLCRGIGHGLRALGAPLLYGGREVL